MLHKEPRRLYALHLPALVFGNILPASTLVFTPASNLCFNTELIIVVPEMFQCTSLLLTKLGHWVIQVSDADPRGFNPGVGCCVYVFIFVYLLFACFCIYRFCSALEQSKTVLESLGYPSFTLEDFHDNVCKCVSC